MYHFISISLYIGSGIIKGMGSANKRWRYNVMPSLIGWAHTQNDPCGCQFNPGIHFTIQIQIS